MTRILCVIDMQNDFIDGVLGTPEAQAIVPKVIEKIRTYTNERTDRVLLSRDTHTENYLETQEGKNLPIIHCVKNTEGWQIPKEIIDAADAMNAWFYDKPSFGSLDWGNFIENYTGIELNDIESIELVGLCTDICVISNAMILKAMFPEVPITVDSSCCAGVTPESHQNALNAMKMCQINII